MPRLPETNACERMACLLDALADDELSALDLAFLDRHTAGCPACAMERELAQEVAQGLAHLPRFSCPPSVTARVLEQAEWQAAARRSFAERLWAAARELPGAFSRHLAVAGIWRPALTAGAAALVAAVLVVSQNPPPEPAFSPREVAQAQAQLELAFAYLGRMGHETGTLVQQELVDHMVKPAFRAMAPAGLSSERIR